VAGLAPYKKDYHSFFVFQVLPKQNLLKNNFSPFFLCPKKTVWASEKWIMIEEIYNKLPAKPYCTDNFEFGINIRSKEIASKAKHIQLNGPTHKNFLVFDVDRSSAAMDWYDLRVPTPNLAIQNPANGHAHLVYGLSVSIRTATNAKIKPLRYAAAIESALCAALDADRGYCGLIAKNPLNNFWRVKEWSSSFYCLDELADSLDLSQQAKNDNDYGIGRNCSLLGSTPFPRTVLKRR
jgi:hypothetical protein